MTRQSLMLIAAAGSVALLLGAYFFQALGWAPCTMCLWQRWPHGAAIIIGAIAVFVPLKILALLGTAAAATTAGLGAFHSGVELKWWDGPATCTNSDAGLSGLDAADLLPGGGDNSGLVLCDTLTPFFLGLTMANWNFLLSAGLALIWLAAAFRRA
ncbi:MAG: disulfide bond formation protein B [Marinovum sp.]|nr:disulfide bond formation protein B [Marinovum sp.]